MQQSLQVSGLVLAGGRGQRMSGSDKGLVTFAGRPLVSYALSALRPLTQEILISANRNRSIYAEFGYPVIEDVSREYQGPLAGILAGLQRAQNPILLVMPCDVPMLTSNALQRLIEALSSSAAEIAVAHDGEFLQPTVLALRSPLKASLERYLDDGQRQVKGWLALHTVQEVDFSDVQAQLVNLNNSAQLQALEQAQFSSVSPDH